MWDCYGPQTADPALPSLSEWLPISSYSVRNQVSLDSLVLSQKGSISKLPCSLPCDPEPTYHQLQHSPLVPPSFLYNVFVSLVFSQAYINRKIENNFGDFPKMCSCLNPAIQPEFDHRVSIPGCLPWSLPMTFLQINHEKTQTLSEDTILKPDTVYGNSNEMFLILLLIMFLLPLPLNQSILKAFQNANETACTYQKCMLFN